MSKKYKLKKVSDRGEDVRTDTKKFDSAVSKLLKASPKTNNEIMRLPALRPKKHKD